MFFKKKPDLDKQLEYLQTERSYLNPLIGGWPTRIHNAHDLQVVKARWYSAVKAADLLLEQHPDSLDAKYLMAEFLRIGHNIDVPNTAPISQKLFQEIIQTDPNHFDAHYGLASLFVSIDPKVVPKAEKLFLKAKELAAPKIIPDIDKGLGFACLFQNRTPDAITYFENYLQLQNDPDIEELLNGIKSGKKLTLVYQNS